MRQRTDIWKPSGSFVVGMACFPPKLWAAFLRPVEASVVKCHPPSHHVGEAGAVALERSGHPLSAASRGRPRRVRPSAQQHARFCSAQSRQPCASRGECKEGQDHGNGIHHVLLLTLRGVAGFVWDNRHSTSAGCVWGGTPLRNRR